MTKGRPRQHELETESELALRTALPVGWVIRDLTKGDYGIDCEVEIFTDHDSTGLTFKVQLKGTDSSRPTRSIPLSDFSYWASLDVPVLIALWRSKERELRALWAHGHDPGPLRANQEKTVVRFQPEQDLTAWLPEIPEQLRLLRSIRGGTIRFPLPLRFQAASPQVLARVQAALRRTLRERDLESILFVTSEPTECIAVELDSKKLRVQLPLNVRSMTWHAPLVDGLRDAANIDQLAVDIIVAVAGLLTPLGTGDQSALLFERTLRDSRVPDSELGAELLEGAIGVLLETRRHEVLVAIAEDMLRAAEDPRTSPKRLALMAAISAPLDQALARRLSVSLLARAQGCRDEGDLTEASIYMFNAGNLLVHCHLWQQGLEALNTLSEFSERYAGEPDFYIARAQAHWWLDNRQSAHADYQKAWDLGRRDAATLDSLADAKLVVGDYDGCSRILAESEEAGIELTPGARINKAISRDVVELTGVTTQARRPVDPETSLRLAESGDADEIVRTLREADVTPALLWRLHQLTGEGGVGSASLAALHNGEDPLAWAFSVLIAAVHDEPRAMIEALAVMGSERSRDFLDVCGDLLSDEVKVDHPDLDFARLSQWVFSAAASVEPKRKGAMRTLGAPG